MKSYFYELDDDNRILWISEEDQREDSPTIELESIEEINVWWDKLVDGEIVKADLESETELNKEGLKAELTYIQQWLTDNDYKINKHALGEYTDDDPRWTTYLAERKEKLLRYNELEEQLEL